MPPKADPRHGGGQRRFGLRTIGVPSGRPGRRSRRVALVCGGVAAILAQLACGGTDGTASPAGRPVTPTGATPADPAATPIPPPTSDGPATAAGSTADRRPGADELPRILADYRRFWEVVTAASRQPPNSWRPALSAVSVEPLLSQLLDGLSEQQRKGLVDYGMALLHPQLVPVRVGRVSVVDCQDTSRSGTLNAETGMVKTVGSPRTPFAGVLERGIDGRWRLSQARFLDGAC